MMDLGQAPPVCGHPAAFGDAPTAPAAGIGWLWVAEGANLGAASLLKRAVALGLGPSFGARHLAVHLDGRGAYWKAFTTAIDALVLDDLGERHMMDGARDAFAHVRVLADASFA
jgi:heme oxygenase